MITRRSSYTAGRVGAVLLLVLVASLFMALRAGASAPSVAVFPSPGSRVAPPGAQIVFRGLPASRFGSITVTGSRSGVHTGRVESDSDGQGGSFLPSQPFTAGETVTVNTSLNVIGGKAGTFHFTVANPAGAVPFARRPGVRRTRGDVWHFQSDPAISPPSIKVTKHSRSAAPGDVFVGSQQGPVQSGAELLDPNGHLAWFYPVSSVDSVTDFKTQTYRGQPVLTWWQGNVNGGTGRGEDMIYNDRYQPVATVHAADGLQADLHEFKITPSNTALITSYYPVYWNASSVHGSRRQIVLDAVVQEIDIRTGLLLYQWDSLDHIPLNSSYAPLPRRGTRSPWDYFHVNSINLDRDGTLVISGRNVSAAYKVSHLTGHVFWTLGGKHSSFRIGSGASFAYQHDVEVQSGHDWYVTVFDDGGGPPRVHNQSRGLKLFLDVKHKKAREVAQYEHSPRIVANYEGNVQQLPDGHLFVGWGQGPWFTEYSSHQVVFDGRFVGNTDSYRAYRFPWTGYPQQPPAIAASYSGSGTSVYASWNGATSVASWRVLGGASASTLAVVGSARNTGFETKLGAPHESYVRVQALSKSGQVLGQSATVTPG